MGIVDHTPRRWLRRALRAPVWLHRHDLGWMLGERFLYLATQGRHTSLRRETILEVVHLDRSTGAVCVVSGWGDRSDWYRNLQLRPALEIRLGKHRLLAPEHHFLNAEQCHSILLSYRDAHPHAWRRLAPMIGLPIDSTDVRALDQVRAVVFHPAQD
ncbi:nitroreductase family deazaflavin-dependent oxidoreductase [Streptosporangium subroseum]|uniref:nitroreductase family deazaflavin-dependent oxidoreductase n=1 Tax=Streptosporangium subroseum TaxID=106412 RepID=UPI003447BDB0